MANNRLTKNVLEAKTRKRRNDDIRLQLNQKTIGSKKK